MRPQTFLLAALAGTAVAGTTHTPACFNLTVPLDITAETVAFKFPPFANGFAAVDFLSQSTNRLATGDPSPLYGAKSNTTNSYAISAYYCAPKSGSGVLQVLTHGLGFDKSYWNFGNATYNWIAAATAAGYSTFSYDRLGTGASPKPDPYTTLQSTVELAVLTKLTSMLKDGTLSPKIAKPSKIVHVGHSYGSAMSNALVGTRPDLSDGVVLTGYSHNSSYVPRFEISSGFHLASENSDRFKNYSTGYLTWPTVYANQFSFLKYPYFDPAVADFAESTKWPFGIGELLTLPAVPVMAPEFMGSVFLTSGDSDLIYCGSVCEGVITGPYSKSPMMFPKAKSFTPYIQPNTGHAMNLHYNASSFYAVVFANLKQNGL